MKRTNYEQLNAELSALVAGIPYETANLANASALLWQEMPRLNWVGFYKMENGNLVLGPFQGKPACIEIPVGRGVCGTAVAELPIHVNGDIWGVLDIDSPYVGRFTDEDRVGLEKVVAILERML